MAKEQPTLRDSVRQDMKTTTTLPFSFKQFVAGMGVAVSRASRNTWNKISDVPDELRNGFSKISGTIQSSTTEIMGSALNSMLNDMKSLAGGIKDITTGTFKKMFSFFSSDTEEDQLDEEKKQTRTLGGIFKIFKKWHIRDMLKGKEKPKGDSGGFFTPLVVLGLALGALTGGIAATIGGAIKYFTIPFEVTFKALRGLVILFKESLIFKKVSELFKSIKSFLGGWVDDALIGIKNFFGKFKLFAGFFKGFGMAFKGIISKIPFIGWFITGIFAVIDFFTGFFGEEGSFFEKIKAGVISMAKGFFDPILQFVGWISDWVMSLFGVETDTGKYLIEKFSGLLNFFFDIFTVHLPNVIGKIWDAIISIKDWVMNFPIKDKLSEMWENVQTAAENLIDSIKKWILSLIPSFDSLKEMLPSIDSISEMWENIQSAAENLIDSIKKWILSLIPSFDSLKEMLPSIDSIKESVLGTKDRVVDKASSLWESTKERAAGLLGKSVGLASETVSDLDAANKSNEMLNKSELVKILQKIEENDRKEAKRREEESRKDRATGNQQVNVSSITNNRGSQGGGTFTEAPDEIENFGIIFMNKTTLGGTF